jgi:WhiB family redox-sensing transcriptional regulator
MTGGNSRRDPCNGVDVPRGLCTDMQELGVVDGTYRLLTTNPDLALWTSDDEAQLKRAKGICMSCPEQRSCLEQALTIRPGYGVYGGQFFDTNGKPRPKRHRGASG